MNETYLAAPRPRRVIKPPRDKEAERVHRLRAAGLCPKCRKPCSPYYRCEYHREYNRLCGILGRAPKP